MPPAKEESPPGNPVQKDSLPMRLRRDPTGLYDLDAHHPVSLDRIADHVRLGGRFTAVAHDSGTDCTRRVLADLLHHITAGPALSAFPGLLGAVTGVGKLGTGLLSAATPTRDEPR